MTTTGPGRDPGPGTEQEEDDVSNHRQSTDPGPSVVSIVIGWALVGGVLVMSGRLVWADPMTEENLIGAMLGLALAMQLVAQAVDRMADRAVARNRVRREAERREREARYERQERARHTGTWEGDGPGQVLTVRWDPAERAYFVCGWLGDFWQVSGETRWSDLETLAAALAELEHTGELVAWEDEGTRSVRARLDLPGWDGVPVRGPGEDTAVIQLPPAVPGPGETLRPIDTPTWATDETQRFPRA